MSKSISFSCIMCDFKINNESDLNYHYLWIHNQWRGNCESPNKISVKTEADNIIKLITDTIKFNQTFLNNRDFEDIVKLVNRLKELNYKLPKILFLKQGELFLYKYEFNTSGFINKKSHDSWLKGLGSDYRFSKKGAKTQRELDDKTLSEENLIKKLTKEVDEGYVFNDNDFVNPTLKDLSQERF